MKNKLSKIIAILLLITVAFTAGSCSCKGQGSVDPVPIEPEPIVGWTPPTPIRSNKYNLWNWYVSVDDGLPTITLTEENYASAEFPVPERDGFTFNGWYMGDTKVADESGKSLMTEELFNGEVRDVTAKFTVNETYSYSILLVFVTSAEADLPIRNSNSDELVHVEYHMSELEREFFHCTAERLKQVLDETVEGLVDFKVDEYYTTETIHTEDLRIEIDLSSTDAKLYPQQIKEITELRTTYDACIAVTSLGSDAYVRSANIAGETLGNNQRCAEVRYDSFAYNAVINGRTLEEQLTAMIEDPEYDDLTRNTSWKLWIDFFIHEHAHILEYRVTESWDKDYDYHNTGASYEVWVALGNDDLLPERYYYLNLVKKSGRTCGIPYGFWKGDIAKVRYEVIVEDVEGYGIFYGGTTYARYRVGVFDYPGSANGYYEIVYGDSITVTARPSGGFEFEGWSDGVETSTRIDVITGDFTVTALFKPIVYTVNYTATEGGHIDGETTVNVTFDPFTHLPIITAVAEEGYRFVGWSDGDKRAQRVDFFQRSKIELFDENHTYTLTAIFEKVD